MLVASQARLLDRGAKDTRDRILHDRRYRLHPSEETLTQNFVSDYVARVRRAGLRATAREFNKYEESHLFGADIALWFYDGAGHYAGIYLQAKRQFVDDTYRGLDHGSRHQYLTLVDGARRDGVLAGYAFYNGLSDPDPIRAACTHGVGATDISGVTIASAESLRPHLRSKVRRTLIEHLCSPLSCLVRHDAGSVIAVDDGSGSGSGGSGGDGGAGGEDDGSPDVNGPTGLPLALGLFANQWPDSGFVIHSVGTAPSYLRQLLLAGDEPAEDPVGDPIAYADSWSGYDPGTRIYDTGDLTLTTQVLLVGPK